MRLDCVLALPPHQPRSRRRTRNPYYQPQRKVKTFSEWSPQTQSVLAKSAYLARVLIRQRHIQRSVGKQIDKVPSFAVRLDSQKHIDFAFTSPYGGGRKGRVQRKRAAAAAKKDAGGDDYDEE